MTTSFYSAFEAHFRGSREEIKSRLRAYAPFWEPFLDTGLPCSAIDLGCGRGEWLELMQELGIESSGVDLDEGMLAIAREHGLKVNNQDALETLRALGNESQSIVSGFHIAEHLAFPMLQELVQEAYRVLRPGGLLILETPNPENIAVATNYFYIDPTHIRPLPPDLMSFLPQYYGFSRTKIMRLQEDPSLLKTPTLTIAQIIHGVSPDYAVIAQKGGLQGHLSLWDVAFERNYGISLGELSDRFYRIESEKNAALQAQYIAILQSSSWRITKPLRIVKSYLRSIEKGVAETRSVYLPAQLRLLSGNVFLRRAVSKTIRLFPFLHKPLLALAKRVGFVVPAGYAAPRLIGDLTHESDLTSREREVFKRLEALVKSRGINN